MIYDFYLPKNLKSRFAREDRPYYAWALEVFKGANPDFSPEEHINELCIHLKKIINALKTASGADAGRVQFFSADNLIRSEKAHDRLRPAVEAARSDLFGKTSPPFSTIRDSSAWLEREIRADEQRFIKAGVHADRVRQIDERIGKLIKERNRLLPGTLAVAVDDQTLDVWKPFKIKKGRGAFYPFRTYPGTRVRRLREQIKDLEALSRFTERGLLYWILADVKPLAVNAILRIQGPFTARDLLAMYKILPIRGAVRQKKISARNAEVIRLVDSLGGAPKDRIMQFWRDTTKAWNKANRERQFTSRDGLKKAYERAERKL
jgi:hypothetical protein